VRRPLVLTGGPAVGKTTCGRALAEERPRAAYIDVDDVRQLIVAGAEAPWVGPEGRDQLALGARNASALAMNFLRAEFEVTIADMLSPTTSRIYREALPGCLVVHLRISLEDARRRAATRTVYLSNDEFEALHHADQDDPPEAEVVLQVEGMSLEEQLDALRAIWARGSAR
jgi:predicted kinase